MGTIIYDKSKDRTYIEGEPISYEEMGLTLDNKTEIVEDMPDFEENTIKLPFEKKESVDDTTDDSENENVSEENPTDNSFNPLQLAFKPCYDRAIAEDSLFADMVKEKENRTDKPKSFSECCDYIMGEFYKYACDHKFDNGNFGFGGCDDTKIVSMIKHYYDEDDIVIKKFHDAKPVVKTTMPTAPVKTAKKPKETPKPVKNTFDISKIITAKKETADAPKRKPKVKDNLLAGFVPMERPNTEKEAKKVSRQQAKSIDQPSLFSFDD